MQKVFTISGFEEDGTYIVDDVTDSFAYVRSTEYFCRVLGQKQYELTNHLGNVLATVLDRKTGVFDPWEDTLRFYEADVVNATLYYPFGSSMLTYSNEEFGYAFGFGGHEKIDEVQGSGNVVDMGDRWLDVRLGRTTKMDAHAKNYTSISPYAYALNNPLVFIDPDGKIIVWANDEASQSMKAKTEALIKQSSAFAVAYNNLMNDPHVFNIRVDSKWLAENKGEGANGIFRATGTSPSEIIFKEGVGNLTLAEEFFHANQFLTYGVNNSVNSGKDERTKQEWEAEANLFQVFVAAQTRDNISYTVDAMFLLIDDDFFNAMSETGYQILENTKASTMYYNYLEYQELLTEGNPDYGGLQRKLLPDAYNKIISQIDDIQKVTKPEFGVKIRANSNNDKNDNDEE